MLYWGQLASQTMTHLLASFYSWSQNWSGCIPVQLFLVGLPTWMNLSICLCLFFGRLSVPATKWLFRTPHSLMAVYTSASVTISCEMICPGWYSRYAFSMDISCIVSFDHSYLIMFKSSSHRWFYLSLSLVYSEGYFCFVWCSEHSLSGFEF